MEILFAPNVNSEERENVYQFFKLLGEDYYNAHFKDWEIHIHTKFETPNSGRPVLAFFTSLSVPTVGVYVRIPVHLNTLCDEGRPPVTHGQLNAFICDYGIFTQDFPHNMYEATYRVPVSKKEIQIVKTFLVQCKTLYQQFKQGTLNTSSLATFINESVKQSVNRVNSLSVIERLAKVYESAKSVDAKIIDIEFGEDTILEVHVKYRHGIRPKYVYKEGSLYNLKKSQLKTEIDPIKEVVFEVDPVSLTVVRSYVPADVSHPHVSQMDNKLCLGNLGGRKIDEVIRKLPETLQILNTHSVYWEPEIDPEVFSDKNKVSTTWQISDED